MSARKTKNRLNRQSSLGTTKVLVTLSNNCATKRKFGEKGTLFFDNFVIKRLVGNSLFTGIYLSLHVMLYDRKRNVF